MALTHEGYTLGLTIIDAAYNAARLYLDAAEGITWEELEDELEDVIDKLHAISDGRVISASVSSFYRENGSWSSIVVPGSEVENVALINAELGDNKTALVRIPAPNDGIFLASVGPNRNVVDVTDAGVKAWLALFTDSGLFTLSDKEQLIVDTPKSGKRIHRKSRKG